MMAPNTIAQLVRNKSELHPDKVAVIFKQQKITYQQLIDCVDDTVLLFRQHGMVEGQHLGVVLPNCLEFVILMITASKMGLTLIPHSTSLSLEALKKAFIATDATHFVVWHQLADDLQRELGNCGETGAWFAVGGVLSEHYGFQALKSADRKHQQTISDDSVIGIEGEQPYILTLTSGSTGDPKPIVLSQKNKITRALTAAELYSVKANDIVLAATPLYHSLAQRLVILPLILGATSVVMSGFSPQKWLSVIDEHRVSFSIAVSSQLAQIYPFLANNEYDLSSLRCLVSSSERLNNNLKSDLLNYLKCEFHECYGASEVAIVTNLDANDCNHKMQSVGRAVPGVDITILNENSEELPVGNIGEIACKTPMLFSGYYKRNDLTNAAMWNGFFKTGDLGYFDEDGYLYYSGRKKELIIVGGINIYPKDIEDVITLMPQVKECAVVAMPHERFNEVPVAFVVPNNENELTERQVIKQCMGHLADFQLPHKIILTGSLPRNAMGKVAKRLLADSFNHKGAKQIA